MSAPEKPEPKLAPPSEIFSEAVTTSGTPVTECELCGRVHYDANGQNMDEGELEVLEEKHRLAPENYIPGDGSVSYGYIDGKQVVWGCQCNKLSRYESFIWRHRFIIAKYLKRRCAEDLEQARSESENANSIPTALFEIESPSRKFDLE